MLSAPGLCVYVLGGGAKGQYIYLVGQDFNSTIIILWPEATSIHQRNIKIQAQREAEERNGYNRLVPTPVLNLLMEKSAKWLSVDTQYLTGEVLDGSYS